ncbi:histidine phosphatase family protein [Alsobacter sp. KACC 23698]|uniref:Histidine phosphatase family protein n=1 Tax=Alsobacter sp. KACC 23698 TaxID=3149229 RepID=A0AAU7JJX5_9HYPH
MASPYRLFFIRHGETDWNAEGRLQGQQDIPINERGRHQAGEAGKRLLRLAPQAGTLPWVVSPLWRTRDTAERARRAIGLDPMDYALDPRLKEISFGDWEGHTWRDLRKVAPHAAEERKADKWRFVPPGGESYAMLAERIRPFAEELAGEQVVVAHGGVARALLYLLSGVSDLVAPSVEIWQGRVLLFENGRFAWT